MPLHTAVPAGFLFFCWQCRLKSSDGIFVTAPSGAFFVEFCYE